MLLDELVTTIEKLKARIERHQTELRKSEALTRYALIDPLLRELGWDTSDPALVMPEYDVDGKRADYALLEGDKVVVFLEAKRLDEPLANHRDQVTNYANNLGIRYPVLTNGNQWEVYDNTKLVPIAEKRVLNISLTNAPASALALQLLLLWRPNLASGTPVAASEPILASALTETLAQTETAINPLPPVPPVSDGWTSLREIQPVNDQPWRPSAIRLPDGIEKEINLWWHVPREVSEYLVRIGKLTRDKCPIKEGHRVDIVHSQPQPSKVGKYDHLHRLSNGLFIGKAIQGSGLVRNAKFLLKFFSEDEGEVWLKPG